MEPLGYGDPLILSYMLIGVFSCVAIAGTIFWIWVIVDCATNEPSEGSSKKIWIAFIGLTHIIGAFVYFVSRRQTRIEQYGK